MGEARVAYTNWTAGELAPQLEGRFDVDNYYNAARQLVNFQVLPYGGAARRMGTRYIASTKYSNRKCLLIPFVFNRDQAYILEVGHLYIRFYSDGGQVMSGGSPYEISTPITEAMLSTLRYAQTADVMYFTHETLAPQKLARAGHTSWSIAAVVFASSSQPSNWVAGNYPRAVSFWERRTVWAGTPDMPQTVWASMAGSMEDLTLGTGDNDGFQYTLAGDEVAPIYWMLAQDQLYLGALDGVWLGSTRNALEPIAPLNVFFRKDSTYGCLPIQGRLINNAAIFVGRNRKQILEQSYNLESNGNVVRNLTMMANHITGSGISGYAWAQYPDSTLWAHRDDGKFISGTYYPPENVLAWAQHETVGEVESMAVIPGETRDDVYSAVKRTVDGSAVRFIEIQTDADWDDIADACYVDSALTYSGSATTTITGLDHLAGETVDVLADGSVHPSCLVNSSGEITLGRAASRVQAGLPYNSTLETLRPELDPSGLFQGRQQRVTGCVLRLYKSVGALVGTCEDDLQRVPFRTTSDLMDTAVPPFTGDTQRFELAGGWNRHGRIMVRQDQPLPLTILAVLPDLQVGAI